MAMYDDPYGSGGIDPNDIIYRDFGISMDDADDWGDDENSDQPLPAGNYKVLLQQGDWKTTNNGNQCVSVRLVVTEGQHKGKVVFDNFWFWTKGNPGSQKAKLKTVRRAVGADVTKCGNLADILGREVMCKILLKKRNPEFASYEGEMENSVSRYFKIPGSQSAPAQAAPKFAPQPQTTPGTPSIIAQNKQAVQAVKAPAAPQQGTAMPTYNTQQGQPQQQAQAQQPAQQPLNQNIQPSEQQQTQDSPF